MAEGKKNCQFPREGTWVWATMWGWDKASDLGCKIWGLHSQSPLYLVRGPLKLPSKTYFGQWKRLLEMRQQGVCSGQCVPLSIERCCLLCALLGWGGAGMDTLRSQGLWAGTVSILMPE